MTAQAKLVPEDASALGRAPTLRTLVQGFPRVGKTHSCIESLVRAFGPGYAINCGTRPGLEPALRATGPGKWKFNQAEYEDEINDCIENAREGCGSASGKFRWIYVDDFNYYVDRLESTYITEDTQKDFGRWRTFCARAMNTVRRLFECEAHVVVSCHLTDWKSGQLQGQNKKDGVGYVNVFPGKLRTDIPGLFSEVTVMKFDDDGRRVLCVNPQGVYGVGCRTTGPIDMIAPDLGILQKEVEKFSLRDVKGPVHPTPVKKPAEPARPAPATQQMSKKEIANGARAASTRR